MMQRREVDTAPRAQGGYRIVREIASGGMATVYLAEREDATGPRREVAVKRLHPHLAQEDEFVTMFFDEARLAARIRHPNVVGVLAVDDDFDALAIVMEYVKGVTLLDLARDQSRRGHRVPHPVVIRIALDALSGLQAAHELLDEKGNPLHIVHRDVSPHNILVGVDGITRITDFGIAKASVRLSVTRDGQTKGKLAYMAPEQFELAELDRRVDLFTTGIVLWELFTGRRLFKGASEAAVVNALLHTELPTMRSVDDTLPEALDAVVMRAMSRRPEDRYATAAEFAVALRKVLAPAQRASVGLLATQAYNHYLAHQRDRSRQAPSASDVRAIQPPPEAAEVVEIAVDEEPTSALATVPDEEPTSALATVPDDEATRVSAAAADNEATRVSVADSSTGPVTPPGMRGDSPDAPDASPAIAVAPLPADSPDAPDASPAIAVAIPLHVDSPDAPDAADAPQRHPVDAPLAQPEPEGVVAPRRGSRRGLVAMALAGVTALVAAWSLYGRPSPTGASLPPTRVAAPPAAVQPPPAALVPAPEPVVVAPVVATPPAAAQPPPAALAPAPEPVVVAPAVAAPAVAPRRTVPLRPQGDALASPRGRPVRPAPRGAAGLSRTRDGRLIIR